MQAGDLDKKLTIYQRTLTKNSSGEAVESYTTVFCTVWAQRIDLAGREYFASAQVNSEITTKFRVRMVDAIDATMRIDDGDRTYDIISVAFLGRREGLEIMAKARRV